MKPLKDYLDRYILTGLREIPSSTLYGPYSASHPIKGRSKAFVLANFLVEKCPNSWNTSKQSAASAETIGAVVAAASASVIIAVAAALASLVARAVSASVYATAAAAHIATVSAVVTTAVAAILVAAVAEMFRLAAAAIAFTVVVTAAAEAAANPVAESAATERSSKHFSP
ncbi:antifreeze protein Maxi-like [Penaeus vannamei]|uniref:antifreeze protein Maxi-like n=1 Tax=Penaeus vannamei TaxID=6689 RepID=UPI00387F64B2